MTTNYEDLNVPDCVKQAMQDIGDDLKNIAAYFDNDTKEFIGIGFIGSDGKYTKFADEKKSLAIEMLERQYRAELIKISRESNCD